MDNVRQTDRKEKLTSARFENLLRRLDPDRGCAGAEYEDLRWQLKRFFEWNCACEAEELVDATLDRLAQKLEEQEIQGVVAFAWGIARNVRLEANKRAARMVAISEVPEDVRFSADEMHTEEELHSKIDQERQLKCLEMCIQRLSEKHRKLFLAYYSLIEDSVHARQKLAASMGLKMNALRVRVNRVRDKVENCAIQCIAISATGAPRLVHKSSLSKDKHDRLK